MELVVQKKKYIFVPDKCKEAFEKEVLVHYFDCLELRTEIIPSECSVTDHMVDMANEICSLEYFEDQHYYKKIKEEPLSELFEEFSQEYFEGRFDDFVHDIVLTFQNFHLAHYLDHDGRYHNLHVKGVW